MSEIEHPCMKCHKPLSIEVVQCPYCGFPLGNGEAPEAWMGEMVDQKYEVEEVLGVGGMGMVFRARRALIGDEVALKILYPHFLKNPLQHRLFQDEAVATAQLDHPNVVTLYDADIDSQYNVAYMAMEILTGYTFKELMVAEAPMSPSLIYPIFIQVCDGLSAAHQVEIIHRDLKPDNLFLSPNTDGDLSVKILDFGIATVMGVKHEDESNKLLGTLRYMAPEQCRGEPCLPQTDLYALGVILYEALTRQRVSGKSVDAVLYDEVIPPNQRLSKEKALPHALEDLIMHLLHKDPYQRPRSALEVRQRLHALEDPFAHDAPAMLHPSLEAEPRLSGTPPAFGGVGGWEEKENTPIFDSPPIEEKSNTNWIWWGGMCGVLFLFSYLWSQ